MKEYINQVLGNSLRCILPSYWWKKLLCKMVDQIESLNSSISGIASGKQNKLVSGENIKTINGSSILGSGNISFSVAVDSSMSDTSSNPVANKVIKEYVDSKANTPVNKDYTSYNSFTNATAVLLPNVYTVIVNQVEVMTVSLDTSSYSDGKVQDYILEFRTASTGTINIEFPSHIKWPNGIKPSFENDATYQISIIRDLAVVTMFL